MDRRLAGGHQVLEEREMQSDHLMTQGFIGGQMKMSRKQTAVRAPHTVNVLNTTEWFTLK